MNHVCQSPAHKQFYQISNIMLIHLLLNSLLSQMVCIINSIISKFHDEKKVKKMKKSKIFHLWSNLGVLKAKLHDEYNHTGHSKICTANVCKCHVKIMLSARTSVNSDNYAPQTFALLLCNLNFESDKLFPGMPSLI